MAWSKAKKFDGSLANCFRFVLIIFNVIIFIAGVLIITFALVLKYTDVFSKIQDEKVLELINVGLIKNVSLVLIILGSFLSLISFIGICGLCLANKCLLTLHLIIIATLFIAHVVVIIVLVVSKGSIEEEFQKSLNKTVNSINTYNKTESNFEDNCKLMKGLSDLFQCCGSLSSQDIINNNKAFECCDHNNQNQTYTEGCYDKVIKEITSNANSYLILPNGIILGVELIDILIIFCLLKTIKRKNAYSE